MLVPEECTCLADAEVVSLLLVHSVLNFLSLISICRSFKLHQSRVGPKGP